MKPRNRPIRSAFEALGRLTACPIHGKGLGAPTNQMGAVAGRPGIVIPAHMEIAGCGLYMSVYGTEAIHRREATTWCAAPHPSRPNGRGMRRSSEENSPKCRRP